MIEGENAVSVCCMAGFSCISTKGGSLSSNYLARCKPLALPLLVVALCRALTMALFLANAQQVTSNKL